MPSRNWLRSGLGCGGFLLGGALSPIAQATLLIDLRVNGGKTAEVSSGSEVISIDVFARINGTDPARSEGLQAVVGSFLSTNVNGGVAQGALAASVNAPFNGILSTGGLATGDLDADGDFDVGSNNNASIDGFFAAHADRIVSPTGADPYSIARASLPTGNPNIIEYKIGTLTFSVGSLLPEVAGASTEINFRKRNHLNGAVWVEDSPENTFNPDNLPPGQRITLGDPTTSAFASGLPVSIVRAGSLPAQWSLNGGGNFDDPASWIGGVPGNRGTARFLGRLTAGANAPANINLNGNRSLSTIVFNNAVTNGVDPNSYVLTGGSLTLDADDDAAIQVVAGTHSINVPVSVTAESLELDSGTGTTLNITGPTTVAPGVIIHKFGAGAVNASGGVTLGPISLIDLSDGSMHVGNLSGPGNVQVGTAGSLRAKHARVEILDVQGTGAIDASGDGDVHANAATSQVGLLRLGPSSANPVGKLDLNNNLLVLKNTPIGDVRNLLIKGRNAPAGGVGNGKWDGTTGIMSSAAAAQNATGERRSIGYALNGDLLLEYSNFGGLDVGPTDILVRYTRPADANLDGVVNNNDITILAGFYRPGEMGKHWFQADFNYDGEVNNNDITILAGNYRPTETPLNPAGQGAALAAVPEPGSAALVGLAAVAMLARRRRRK